MASTIYFYMMWAAALSPLIPLTALVLRINRQTPEFRWLTIFLAFAFSCEMVGMLVIILKLNPNIPGNFYWLFSISLLSIFFYDSIKQAQLKAVLVAINIAYVAFALINIVFVQKASLNTYSQTFNALFVLVFCIVFYYKLLNELPTQQLHKLPMFWIISAFFFSYAGKLVVYTFANYLIQFEDDDLLIIWSFHNFLTIIGNLLITYGAWLNYRQSKATLFSL